MSAVQQPPQQMVFVTGAPASRPELAKGACRGLGITQLVFGIVVLIIDIVIIDIFPVSVFHLLYRYQGIWGGIIMIIAGSLGIAASRSQSRGLDIGCAVLSIFATLFALPGMGIAFAIMGPLIVAAAGTATNAYFQLFVALFGVQGIIFLAEFGVAIAQSVVCFRHGCSGTQTTQTTVISTAHVQPNQGQVYYNPAPQQTGVVYGQPGAAPPYDTKY